MIVRVTCVGTTIESWDACPANAKTTIFKPVSSVEISSPTVQSFVTMHPSSLFPETIKIVTKLSFGKKDNTRRVMTDKKTKAFSKSRLELEEQFSMSPKSSVSGADKNRSPLNVLLTIHDTLLRGDTKKQGELISTFARQIKSKDGFMRPETHNWYPTKVPDERYLPPDQAGLFFNPWKDMWWQVLADTFREFHPKPKDPDLLFLQITTLMSNPASPIHFGCVDACETCDEVVATLSKGNESSK